MNSSSPNPKLPLWIFIATDVALIGAAAVIALRSAQPLSASAMLAIVACVALGAIVGLVPIVAGYERQKNEVLDERQRALEALARTLGSSAEQISIAAGSLHEIADVAQKNLRLAEHLPHKLQDKIAEFQAQLAAATDTDKEELERELLALRTTESERLDSVSQRIAKSTADWAKLESATHQHLTAANEAVAKLAAGTASAIAKAQAAAEHALSQARIEAARALGEAAGHATHTLETAQTAALAELETKLAAAASTIVERVSRDLTARLAAAAPARTSTPPASPEDRITAAPPVSSRGEDEPMPAANIPAAPAPTDNATDQPGAAGPTPKRPRRMRRDEPAVPANPSEQPASSGTTASDTPAAPTAAHEHPATPVAVPSDEPPPIPASTIPEITPVAPATAEPFSGHIATEADGIAAPIGGTETISDAAKMARKRPKKMETGVEPELGLELDDTPLSQSGALGERMLTSDGATRLLVTAYIGIGNRLFIRGEGPGLSWEKGTPLQFVSIGKWRWETRDTRSPVQFKLYKNDDVECSALGTQSIDPGHQQEVTASF